MQINDLVDIKSKNIKKILDCIRSHRPMTKKQIADETGLSFATVSNLCNELHRMGITENSKNTSSRIGRTPNCILLRSDRFLNVILDFRIENTLSLAIVDIENNVLYQTTLDTTVFKTPEEVVAFAYQTFENIVKMLRLEDAVFLRLGAAVPAIYDSVDGCLKTCTIPLFEKAPLKKMLATAFALETYVDNIANFCALSASSRVRNQSSIVCLDISQGVGVGVIINGILVRGKNGYGGEIAHVPIGDMNAVCPVCHRNGCAEILLSVVGMVGLYQEIPKDIPILKRWQMFVEMMRRGDETSCKNAETIGLQLGRLATILINIFDPSYFSISGYIADIYDLLEPFVSLEINARCPLSVERDLKIDVCKSTFDSVYLGVSDALYESWSPLDEMFVE